MGYPTSNRAIELTLGYSGAGTRSGVDDGWSPITGSGFAPGRLMTALKR